MEDNRSLVKILPRDMPIEDKPFHAKRSHRKSRNGCRNCKTRKIKCNEQRPSCRSCLLRKENCVYPKAQATLKAQASTALVPTSPASTSITPPSSRSDTPCSSQSYYNHNSHADEHWGSMVLEPAVPLPGRDTSELRLLWFYTSVTYSSFLVSERASLSANIFKSIFVQRAFETPFMMDCLLGLATMHMELLNQPVDSWRTLAYQARAFAGYRRAIEDAKPETYSGLLACPMLFAVFSTTMFRTGPPEEGRLKIAEWMMLWRGIKTIVITLSIPAVLASEMEPLFHRPTLDLDGASASIPHHLSQMIALIPPDDPDAEYAPAYLDALRYLGSLYQGLKSGLGSVFYSKIVSWFTYLPAEFATLVRQERPRALVIVAHYCAFCRFLEPLWWMRNVGTYGVQEISARIGPSEYMRMPLAAITLPASSIGWASIPLARIILQDPLWIPTTASTWDPRKSPIGWVDDKGRAVVWPDAMKV